jgi:hypothetical protein
MTRAVVYANWGRWVARCPRPGCPGAEHFGPDAISGHVGGLTGIGFRCAHCGLVCAADWPPNVDDIMRLLLMRPVPANRNWEPGQTVHDLLAENVEQGCVPLALDPDEPLIRIVGDKLTAGYSLPAPDHRALPEGGT